MKFDRAFWLCFLFAAAIIGPRAYLVSRATSECIDDEYQLIRGLRYWHGTANTSRLNDPPLGGAIGALPLLLAGCTEKPPAAQVLYDQPLKPETLLTLIALWKAALFVPLVPLVFAWVRAIYNTAAGAAAAVAIAFEPTVAGHIGVGAFDVLSAEAILLALMAAWAYGSTVAGASSPCPPAFAEANSKGQGLEAPATVILTLTAFLTAAAMMIKHTAIILPVVIVASWLIQLGWRRAWRPSLALAVATPIFIWALCGFEIATPRLPSDWMKANNLYARVLDRNLPAATYINSLAHGLWHADRGHAAYLFGESHYGGWWYYLPVVATYKVSIGFLAVGAIAALSLLKGVARSEWVFILPALAWSAFLMQSKVSMGWRHALVPELLFVCFAARVLTMPKPWKNLAWIGVGAGALHSLAWYPNYLAYINAPRAKPYLALSDSNIDWGQGLKQIRDWIDHDAPRDRPIYLRYFGREEELNVDYYLGDRVRRLNVGDPPPTSGLLVISPVWLVPLYAPGDPYAPLRKVDPIAKIGGGSNLVFDLDAIASERR